ncbi:P-loop containing nucleoside triphosphate hydrolase protein [Atractiella rhizophila]|nr:P-loop containing nucleoside triphosphate hydrolase protein [Atractiella rhizophila]
MSEMEGEELDILPARATKVSKRQRKADELKERKEKKEMSKKRKRKLEKYIDSKLKKEERKELLGKLATSSLDPTSKESLSLISSATLGSRKLLTNAQRLNDIDQKKQTVRDERRARKRRKLNHEGEGDDESEDEEMKVNEDGTNKLQLGKDTVEVKPTAFGGALKDGVKPVIVVRTRQKRQPVQPPSEESSFDSSASSNDSPSPDSSDAEADLPIPHKTSELSHAKGSFREWAEQQVRNMTSTNDATTTTGETLSVPQFQSRPEGMTFYHETLPSIIKGPLGEEIIVPHDELPQQNFTPILLSRPPDLPKLPIEELEHEIMSTIRSNVTTVIVGETGCGKTTRLPSMLYEYGWGNPSSENPGIIGVTQPRRVAAMSLAQRVAWEMGLKSPEIAYSVRYDTKASKATKVQFMTDGVLLRELGDDFLLKRYSAIVVDEAHERSVNTDVLLGVLGRVAKLREKQWRKELEKGDNADLKNIYPLRLVIMSATLRLADFLENKHLFPIRPPCVEIPGRAHPVTNHYSKKTSPDYVQDVYNKVCKIHVKLPPGGVLAFLTGKDEINSVCRKLEKRFGVKAFERRKKEREMARKRPREDKEEEKEDEVLNGLLANEVLEAENVDLGLGRMDHFDADVDENAELEPQELDLDEDEDEDQLIGLEDESQEPMYILPLYALLPPEKQLQIFSPPPPGTRLVVIATNVAETSLTIPNIRYVVDSGRVKERHFDPISGIQSFQVSWISKAAAAQRAGRAGRTGPGHCYRSYSSAVFDQFFAEHSQPEILRMPIEGIVMQMKSMNIDNVANFPFPTPPDRTRLQQAEELLTHLGAITQTPSNNKRPSVITDLGRAMAAFPLNPRYSKMLVTGQQHGCLPYVICMVAGLSVGDPFVRDSDAGEQNVEVEERAEAQHIKSEDLKRREAEKSKRKAYFEAQQTFSSLGGGVSDVFKILAVVGAYEYDGGSSTFCTKNFVMPKAMEEIHKLRGQLTRIVAGMYPKMLSIFEAKLKPPSELQLKVLRQLITASFVDSVAIRLDLLDKVPQANQQRLVPYRALGVDEDVFIHHTSVLSHSPPDFLVYQELFRSSRVWLKHNTKINAAWLPILGKSLCTFSKPVEDPLVTAKYLKGSTSKDPNERDCMVIPKFGPGLGVELPLVKVKQKRVGNKWVFV